MTTQPVAPALLGRDSAYYRTQAEAVDRLLEHLATDERTPQHVEKLQRQRHLWHQLANELDAYLERLDDTDPLF